MASAADAIKGARRMLHLAEVGIGDYDDGADRRLPGLYQAVTSLRSVTFVLQNMRSSVDDFESWWSEKTAELGADPVARWLVKLRNRMEKRGSHGDGAVAVTVNTNPASMARLQATAPEHTVGLFSGDGLGRSGWEVQLPDGTTTQVFFTPPSSMIMSTLHLEGAPDGRDVAALLKEYAGKMQALIDEAEMRFGGA